jgi:Uma2 family endonuclease
MSQDLIAPTDQSPDFTDWLVEPDISHLVIEDDVPVDNLFSEKQQRLLTEPLYSNPSALESHSFLVSANVGVFYAIRQPPLVPDVFLSLDVAVPQDWSEKKNRTYFVWEFGKPPDVVIEIVSNQVGKELGSKLTDYARMGVSYYAVYDPLQQLGDTLLQVFEARAGRYQAFPLTWFEQLGIGLMLWEGVFEGKSGTWLRWCDRTNLPIPTGAERAEQERQRADQEQQRANQEQQRAEQAEAKAAKLAAQLRKLGIEPEDGA